MAAPPDCASWPTDIALVKLKNAGITAPDKLDASRTKAVRLASERIGRDLHRQIYDITFHERTGRTIEVVTSSDASSTECSMSDVDVYVVERKLGGR